MPCHVRAIVAAMPRPPARVATAAGLAAGLGLGLALGLGLGLGALAWLACPGLVHAAKGEQAVSAGVRYGQLTLTHENEQVSLDGGVLVLEYERGLGDTYGVRAHIAGGAYDGPAGRPIGGAAALGLVYRFDVVRAVPYLQASLGAIAAQGGGIDATLKPTMEIGAGLDFLESRSFGWGVALAWDAFASEARFLTVGVRASWRWGWW